MARAEASLPNPARLRTSRRIEWIDTDAAGIYHWTTAFRLAEAAEAALHTELGIADRTFGVMPRVAATADFRRPLRFNDVAEVEISVRAMGTSSISYSFTIHAPDGIAVEGTFTGCNLDPQTGRPAPWATDIRLALSDGGPR